MSPIEQETSSSRVTRSSRRRKQQQQHQQQQNRTEEQVPVVENNQETNSIYSQFGESAKIILQHFSNILLLIGGAFPRWLKPRDNVQSVQFSHSLEDLVKMCPPRGSPSSTVSIPKTLRLNNKSLQVEALSFRLLQENSRLGTTLLLSHSDVKFYHSPNLKTPVPFNTCSHSAHNSIWVINGAQLTAGRGILAIETLVRDLAFSHVMIQLLEGGMVRGITLDDLMNQINLITKILKTSALEKARNRFIVRHGANPEDVRYLSAEGRYTHGFIWNYSIFNLRERPSTPFFVREVSLECPRCCIFDTMKKFNNVMPEVIPQDKLDCLIFLSQKIRSNSPLSFVKEIPMPVQPCSGLSGEDSIFTNQAQTNLNIFVDDRELKTSSSKRPLTESREVVDQVTTFNQQSYQPIYPYQSPMYHQQMEQPTMVHYQGPHYEMSMPSVPGPVPADYTYPPPMPPSVPPPGPVPLMSLHPQQPTG